MVVIDINGQRVEAQTLKEAQKLARKEEKRQAAILKQREDRRNRALDICYRRLATLAQSVTRSDWYVPASDCNFHKTERGFLSIGLGQSSISFTDSYSPSVFILSVATGRPTFAQLFSRDEATPQWHVFGEYEGESMSVRLMPLLADI